MLLDCIFEMRFLGDDIIFRITLRFYSKLL